MECKLLVYDLEGHVIFRSSRKYREEGRDGFRELNPEVVLENVKIILSEAGKKLSGKYRSFGSSQSWRISCMS